MSKKRSAAALLFFFLCLLGFTIEVYPQQQASQCLFKTLTSTSTNITFNNHVVETDSLNIVNHMNHWNGGGVAVGDLDNDGLPDVVFAGNQVGVSIYKNLGKLKFKNLSNSLLPDSLNNVWISGITMVDYDADGLKDLYICRRAGVKTQNVLLKNQGEFLFKDVSQETGLIDNGYSTHAVFHDFDKDGDLDVYVLNNEEQGSNAQVISLKRATRRSRDLLFFQQQGLFVDVSDSLLQGRNRQQLGLSICEIDVDWDGTTELFICNDLISEDRLLKTNPAKGKWSNEIRHQISHTSANSMGCAVGDLNNDLWPDLMVLDMLADKEETRKIRPQKNVNKAGITATANSSFQLIQNTLQLNRQGKCFSEASMYSNIHATDWSWGPLIADFNNDGFQDVFITTSLKKDILHLDYIRYHANSMSKMNPRLRYRSGEMLKILNQRPDLVLTNHLFLGSNNGVFKNESLVCPELNVNSNGAAYADLDLDGDLDIILNNLNETSTIMENLISEQKDHHFVQITFSSDFPAFLLYGTKVILFSSSGTKLSVISSTQGFQSSSEAIAHFGMADEAVVDSAHIYLPNNELISIHSLRVDSRTRIDSSYLMQTKRWNGPPCFLKPKFSLNKLPLPAGLNAYPKQLFDFGSKMNRLNLKGPKVNFPLVSHYSGLEPDQKELFHLATRRGSFGEVYRSYSDSNSVALELVCNLDTLAYQTIGDESRFSVENSLFGYFDSDDSLDLLLSGANVPRRDSSTIYSPYLISNISKPSASKFQAIHSRISLINSIKCENDKHLIVFGGAPLLENYPEGASTKTCTLDSSTNSNVNSFYEQFQGVIDIEQLDLDSDGADELIIAQENRDLVVIDGKTKCTEPKLLENTGLEGVRGWWQCMKTSDLDQDGDLDLIIGNFGRNWLPEISIDHPLYIYKGDVDSNGKKDPVALHYVDKEYHPLQSRDDLLHQVTQLKKKYTSYQSFADSDYQDFLVEIDTIHYVYLNEFRNLVAINENGKFSLQPLPTETELGTTNHIFVKDYNLDGTNDILLFGNSNNLNSTYGMPDGNTGIILEGEVLNNRWSVKKIHHLGLKGIVTGAVEFKQTKTPTFLITFSDRLPELFEIISNE